MKRLVCITIGIVLLSIATSFFAAAEQERAFRSLNAGFALSDSNLKEMKKKALEGDAESAFKVFLHYNLGKFDSISSFPWLQMAANKGHAVAQYNLGYIYMFRPSFKNLQLARFWLKEAEKNGSTRATELLTELDKLESSQD